MPSSFVLRGAALKLLERGQPSRLNLPTHGSMEGCGRAAGAVARWSKEHVRKAKKRIWRYFALKQCFLAFIVDAPVDPDHGQAGFRPSRGATEFADREALIDVRMGKIVFNELK